MTDSSTADPAGRQRDSLEGRRTPAGVGQGRKFTDVLDRCLRLIEVSLQTRSGLLEIPIALNDVQKNDAFLLAMEKNQQRISLNILHTQKTFVENRTKSSISL